MQVGYFFLCSIEPCNRKSMIREDMLLLSVCHDDFLKACCDLKPETVRRRGIAMELQRQRLAEW